jgi:integrase
MNIEKYKKNTYRVRKQYKGKKYTVYFDHKPTQKEALQAMAAEMDKTKSEEKVSGAVGTVESAIKQYIADLESGGASPATIRGHESILRNLSEDFKRLSFIDITNEDVQREVDLYASTRGPRSVRPRSPKTVRNMYGLIWSTVGKYRPQLVLHIKLPAKEARVEYEPTTQEVQNIIDHSKGTRYHIPLQLAVLGVRRGEVCALTLADLNDDNVLTISKDVVLDRNNELVLKGRAKTQASNRRILIPSELADEIRAQGYIWKGNPHTINEYLHKAQDDLSIPRFRLHMLRHFCVAYLHKQGFTSEQIMAWGGWSTDSVMKQAYRYNLDPHESKKDISDKLGSLF